MRPESWPTPIWPPLLGRGGRPCGGFVVGTGATLATIRINGAANLVAGAAVGTAASLVPRAFRGRRARPMQAWTGVVNRLWAEAMPATSEMPP